MHKTIIGFQINSNKGHGKVPSSSSSFNRNKGGETETYSFKVVVVVVMAELLRNIQTHIIIISTGNSQQQRHGSITRARGGNKNRNKIPLTPYLKEKTQTLKALCFYIIVNVIV